jgi:hypothetical protein
LLVRLLHVDLNKGAGQLLRLPRRGGLAGAQTDNHVLPANRLSRMKGHVLDDPVALVEDAEDRGPLRHGRYAALSIGRRPDLAGGGQGLILLGGAFPARGKRERNQQRCSYRAHAYSGIQGS